jgi:hypothetical protein
MKIGDSHSPEPLRPQSGPAPSGPVLPKPPAREPVPFAQSELLKLAPEQATTDLHHLLSSQSPSLPALRPGPGALPPSLPASLSGLQVSHQQVGDWTETRLGEFTQRSRLVESDDGGEDWQEVCDDQGQSVFLRQSQEPDDGLGPWQEVSTANDSYKVRYRLEEQVLWCDVLRNGVLHSYVVENRSVHDSST